MFLVVLGFHIIFRNSLEAHEGKQLQFQPARKLFRGLWFRCGTALWLTVSGVQVSAGTPLLTCLLQHSVVQPSCEQGESSGGGLAGSAAALLSKGEASQPHSGPCGELGRTSLAREENRAPVNLFYILFVQHAHFNV